MSPLLVRVGVRISAHNEPIGVFIGLSNQVRSALEPGSDWVHL